MQIENPKQFVHDNTVRQQVPFVNELELHLASDAVSLWQKTEDELGEMDLPPPFWAFAWAGGQALARHILDHPETVRGKTVLDFASGSGIVAIAAAKSGADSVLAAEIDKFACAAVELNSEINGVEVKPHFGDLTITPPASVDVLILGDVFYEHPMTKRILNWLKDLDFDRTTVLVGDPGRSYLPKERLELLSEYVVPVIKSLEDSDTKKTAVYRMRESR